MRAGWKSMLVLRTEAGSRPACEWLSFASPKESHQRKGDPAVRVPSLRCGQPRCSGRGCAAELTARYALRSNKCGESVDEVRVSFGTRTHPLPCASRHTQKGTQGADIHTGLCFARPVWSARAQPPRAAPAVPSAAMARVAVGCWLLAVGCWLLAVGCWLCSASPPSGGACVGAVSGWHARRSAHAPSTDSPWLSERRAQRKASSTAHPATATAQVCPVATRRGR